MLPATSSDAEGFRRRVIAFRKPLDPLLKAHISAFRPVLRFTDFNGHIACGHERGYGRSISRGKQAQRRGTQCTVQGLVATVFVARTCGFVRVESAI